MRRIILILLIALGGHTLLMAAPPSSLRKCVDRVSAQYAPLKRSADLKVERQFQADLARCATSSLSKAQASCVGAANYDYARLARQLKERKITPAQYLQRVRDRSRKAAHCMEDASWTAAFVKGDEDGDLVPDKFDRCPRTPELVATDDTGCPVVEPQRSEGPSSEDVDRVFRLRTVLENPKCVGAPVPTVPAVVKFESVGFPTISPPKLRSEFRKAVNQPAGCPVVYEVKVEEVIRPVLDDPTQTAPRMPVRIWLLLKPRDALNASDPTAEVLSFESLHPRLVVLFHQGARAQVRAINGNGTASAWSQKVHIPGR